MVVHPLHSLAVELAAKYRRIESELLGTLQKIEQERLFDLWGYRSMAQYCIEGLKLSESQAFVFIGVARKCAEVPALQAAIDSGRINVSTARRMISAITPENCESWIFKAECLTQRNLEREVAKENPERVIRESLKPVTQSQAELRCAVSYELEKKLTRCREILNQKSDSAASWEQVITAMADLYLKTQDPNEKAKRFQARVARKASQLSSRRVDETNQPSLRPVAKPRRLPAALRHQVMLRDNGVCQHKIPGGKKCNQSFWVDIHHIKPLVDGGKHELSNLITLCSTHHEFQHAFEGQHYGRAG